MELGETTMSSARVPKKKIRLYNHPEMNYDTRIKSIHELKREHSTNTEWDTGTVNHRLSLHVYTKQHKSEQQQNGQQETR